MSAIIANFMFRLPYNFKPAKLILRIAPTHCFFLYKVAQSRIPDGLTEGLQLVLHAFSDQFDSAVAHVPDTSGDFKAGGNGLHCITKTHTLHVTRVKNLHPPSIHSTAR